MNKNKIQLGVILIVIVAVISIIFFLANKKDQNSLELNITPSFNEDQAAKATPTSAIINPTDSQATPAADAKLMDDGLVIQDLVIGNGNEVKSGDTVTVNYVGTLQSGEKFDSSYDRNTPFTTEIGVGAVIKGWDEGIVGMKTGGKRKLIIPPDLGYGASGVGGIPPNSTLVFEVELISIK